MFAVKRPINGISINGDEWLLDDQDENPRLFPDIKSANVLFDGNIDEDKSGYVCPELDIYLKTLESEFKEYMNHNRWEGRKLGGWEIITSEIIGPDSSGYPNSLTFTIGVLSGWKDKEGRILELINAFNK
jgi:hypothetical protein